MSQSSVTIHDLARGGAGVSRTEDGRVVFIPRTLPGDEVEFKITKEDKKFAFGEVVNWIKKSDQHQEPKCQYFQKCGGCDWQHVPYSFQWETKLKGVQDTLKKRQVGCDELEIESFPAEKIWNYRNRVQFHGSDYKIGFYAKKSNQLVPVEKCEIADEAINEQIEDLKKNRRAKKKEFKVEVEVLNSEELAISWNQKHSALGFRQINSEQNLNLKSWIQNQIQDGDQLLDLYGGAGNLSLDLAPQFENVIIVDSFAKVPEEKPSNVRFELSSVKRYLQSAQLNTSLKTSIIMDPPRVGLGEDFKIIEPKLSELNINEMIVVGCDLDRWASDLKKWVDSGWKVQKIAAFDFFPHTVKVETVAKLTRS